MVLKVLQINSGEKFGGISSMIYNIYKQLDRSKIQFDFVAPKRSSYDIYRNDIYQMGGRIIELKSHGNFIVQKIMFWIRLYRLIKKEKYKVVHINSGTLLFNLQVAIIARMCQVEKIIMHSHNAGNDRKFYSMLNVAAKPLAPVCATHFLACSKKAAEYMYPPKIIENNKYIIIKNGININKFKYNSKVRTDYRKKLNIENKTVLLHVGRFVNQKNHMFLVEIFNCYHKEAPESVLILVGDGELKSQIEKRVQELGIGDSVIFLGIRKDIPNLMSASDIFCLPSLYEGLPVVGVEAQASGLPCCFSDTITDEIDLTNNNVFVSLNESAQDWSNAIKQLEMKKNDRLISMEAVIKNGYSLEDTVKRLQEVYMT